MAKFILIHKEDNIADIIEKIQSLKESEVYLVAPDDSALLEGFNSEILIEEAASLGKKIYLSVFSEKVEDEKKPVKKDKKEKTDEKLSPEKEKAFHKFFSRTKFTKTKKDSKIKLKHKNLILKAAIALIAIFLIYYFSPYFGSLKINVMPKETSMNFDMSVDATPLVSDIVFNESGLSLVPAQVIEVQKEGVKTISSTGKGNVKTKAHGFITVYNAYGADAQKLIQNTRFLSGSGKLFRNASAVTVPPKPGSIKVEVLADQVGSDYNIESSEFTIPGLQGSPKYNGFYGRSFEAMTGGAIGESQIVTKDDLLNAKNNLIKELEDQAKEEAQARIPDGLIVPDGFYAFKIILENYSEKEDSAAEKFNAAITISLKALAINEKDIKALIRRRLENKIKENEAIKEEAGRVDYADVKTNWGKEAVGFKVKSENVVFERVDLENIKNKVVGLHAKDISNILGTALGVEKSEVIFWPFWLRKTPLNQSKIKIVLIP